MNITIPRGDFGREYPLYLHPVDGQGFTASELQVATYLFRVWRTDRVRLDVAVDDTKINLTNRSSMHYYQIGDTILIGDEQMLITAIDSSGKQISVTRTDPVEHRKGSMIRHIVYESPTAVTWEPTQNRTILTMEPGMDLFSGQYRFEVEVDTGTRKASAVGPHPNHMYTLRILKDLSGS